MQRSFRGYGIPERGWRGYGSRAFDLARYQADPTDRVVAAFVDGAANRQTEYLAQLRSELSEQDQYTLLHFARREAAAALRDHDPGAAHRAVTALTLIDCDHIDYRDLSVDFPLYAVRQTGGSTDAAITAAIERAAHSTGSTFEAARIRARALTLYNCALLAVESAYGLGFMRRVTSYDPRTGIAELAITLADCLDEEGCYLTDKIEISDLPEVWFHTDWRVGKIPVNGCASISCPRRGSGRWSHGLLVFVAQLDDARTAGTFARQARRASKVDQPRIALNVGNRLLVIIGGSATAGQRALETSASLERFGAVAAGIM